MKKPKKVKMSARLKQIKEALAKKARGSQAHCWSAKQKARNYGLRVEHKRATCLMEQVG